tara:strand:+ start:4601 stop:5062 length:462 start_codon:yes stop_codon:yes gene_type:complete
MHVIQSIDEAKELIDKEIGLSDWANINQKQINQFAKATSDFQWIHVDTERAKREMPGGKTIAHGYLIISLIPSLTDNFIHIENLARAVNFGLNKVRFYTPIPVDSRLRCRAIVKQARQRGDALVLTSEVRIELDGQEKPACVAEIISMYFFEN